MIKLVLQTVESIIEVVSDNNVSEKYFKFSRVMNYLLKWNHECTDSFLSEIKWVYNLSLLKKMILSLKFSKKLHRLLRRVWSLILNQSNEDNEDVLSELVTLLDINSKTEMKWLWKARNFLYRIQYDFCKHTLIF